MLCAVIMAGGRGTRFWPQSTEEKPKQFLKLVSDKSMLQVTFDRINKLIPEERIFVCTGEKYKDLVKECVPNISEKNIILEPCGKNTAPCILLSTLYVRSIYPDCSIVTLASDHLINDEDNFIEEIKKAENYVSMNDAIVTLGIKPTRPETGYGYIKYISSDNAVLNVEKFVEKPDYDTALEYVKAGNYLWNAGIFIFNSNYILSEFEKYMKPEFELLSNIPYEKFDANYYLKLSDAYSNCTKISFDNGIVEKSDSVCTIPTNFGWDDVGTWNSLKRYIDEDSMNNLFKGDVEAIDSKNNIVYANNKKIILFDVNDIFCIDSDDVIVIGKKDRIEEVHNLKND